MAQINDIQSGMNPIRSQSPVPRNERANAQPVVDHAQDQYKTFSETLHDFMNDVNNLQEEAGKSVEKLLTGEIKDVHDVMIAVEKAGTSFELMMELRNKMIDAYHEIMRLQM
jgi:flagellar hook-basal body complex protein FliE